MNWLGFFFVDALSYDPNLLIGKKMDAAGSLAALQQAREVVAGLDPFD